VPPKHLVPRCLKRLGKLLVDQLRRQSVPLAGMADQLVAAIRYADPLRVDAAVTGAPAPGKRSDTGDSTATVCDGPSYNCGVRSNDVTVDILVINHFASSRCIVNRYDR
jgi:hypothetical protein